MNDEAVKLLQEITKKEIQALTETDIRFLRARSSYLTDEQKRIYHSVLFDKPQYDEKMKREALDAIAVEKGLDPADYENKKVLIEAILRLEEEI